MKAYVQSRLAFTARVQVIVTTLYSYKYATPHFLRRYHNAGFQAAGKRISTYLHFTVTAIAGIQMAFKETLPFTNYQAGQ